MSQIIHTKSRSAFSARRNLSIVTLQFHDSSKELLYRQASVARHSSDEKGTKVRARGVVSRGLESLGLVSCQNMTQVLNFILV